jgi:hypothetical protein
MASPTIVARRRAAASAEAQTNAKRIAELMKFDLPPAPPPRFIDAAHAQAASAEYVAQILALILRSLESGQAKDSQPDPDADVMFADHPLSFFDGMTDEQALEVEGVGKATLKRIREAQAERDARAKQQAQTAPALVPPPADENEMAIASESASASTPAGAPAANEAQPPAPEGQR